MNLQDSIRKWLGISDMLRTTQKINADVDDLDKDIRRLRQDQIIQSAALARIVAKVDPHYATQGDELSPERRAESDRISKMAIDRLYAEAKARDAYNQGT